MNPRWQTPAAVAGLLGAAVVFLHRVTLGGEYFFARDAARLVYPLRAYAAMRLRQGELPLWFPYDGLGVPYIDVAVTGLFHPFTLLFVVLNGPGALNVSTFLCYPLALLGTYALLRTYGTRQIAAVAGACLFGFCGYLASMSNNLVFLYSTACLPLLICLLERALWSNRIPAWLGFAFVFASIILNGDFQDALWYGILCLAYGAAGRAVSQGARTSVVRRGAWILGSLSFSVLLCGVQVVPAWTLFRTSERLAPAAFHDLALRWSVHPLRLLSLIDHPAVGAASEVQLAADFFGVRDPAWGFWASSIYLGPLAIALALTTIRRGAPRIHRFYWGLALASLGLSLGRFGGLYDIAYRVVPFWSAFRYPEKLIGIFSFGIAVLAGFGVDRFGSGAPVPWKGAFAAVGAVLLVVALVSGPAQPLGIALLRPLFSGAASDLDQGTTALLGLWHLGARWGLAALGLPGILLALLQRGRVGPAVAGPALIALILADLGATNMDACRTTPVTTYEFVPPLVDELRAREGNEKYRILTAEVGARRLPGREFELAALDLSEAEVVADKNALELEHNALYGIESAGTYLPATTRMREVLRGHATGRLLGALNVKYLVTLGSGTPSLVPSFRSISRSDLFDTGLWENPAFLPRARIGPKVESVSGESEIRERLLDPGFPFESTALVEGTAPGITGGTGGSAEIASERPERVVVNTELEQEGLLLLADSFYPGWRAVLDGAKDLPVYRADGFVRGVFVPAGRHEVVFEYSPLNVRVGLAVTLAALIAAGVGLAISRRRTA